MWDDFQLRVNGPCDRVENKRLNGANYVED